MSLRLYDTLSGEKRTFSPIAPPAVRMYVCGVTVYDLSHIGHARCYIVFDTLYRLLRARGYDVTYVRNFTDIDDKIIRRAEALGEPFTALTERFIGAYTEDMHTLGLNDPQVEPRATAHIQHMIAHITGLIHAGHAYATADGDVYFAVRTFADYGKLSKKVLDELAAGASGRVDDERGKRDPADFALWKAAKPGEPFWDSPWGPGRPGWHIECSAMAGCHLGAELDIHAGGKDLKFPHHENEIAQTEALTGRPFARFWLHSGFINVPKREDDDAGAVKMSKSLNNFWTIRDALAAYHPEAVKLLMHQTHYRNDILFDDTAMREAQGRLVYLYETLRAVRERLATRPAGETFVETTPWVAAMKAAFDAAMDDDMNTPEALATLSEPFAQANRLLAEKKIDAVRRAAQLRAFLHALEGPAAVLGILGREPEAALDEIRERIIARRGIDKAAVEALVADRAAARRERRFADADAARDALGAMGIDVMDAPDGRSRWAFKL